MSFVFTTSYTGTIKAQPCDVLYWAIGDVAHRRDWVADQLERLETRMILGAMALESRNPTDDFFWSTKHMYDDLQGSIKGGCYALAFSKRRNARARNCKPFVDYVLQPLQVL